MTFGSINSPDNKSNNITINLINMKGGNFASTNNINQFIIQSEKADKEREKLGITGNEGKS